MTQPERGEPTDLSDAVLRVERGDLSAFRFIVDATSDRLVRLSSRMLGDQSEGEDIVQEAYVKAYEALTNGRFDGRASIATWLYRVVANGCIDAMRSRARRPNRLDVIEPTAAETNTAEAKLALKELATWLDDLPPEQRAALTLQAVEGLSSKEIGEILGLTEGAVEQRLVRARAALREKRNAS